MAVEDQLADLLARNAALFAGMEPLQQGVELRRDTPEAGAGLPVDTPYSSIDPNTGLRRRYRRVATAPGYVDEGPFVNASDLGLGQVDNTSDAQKVVEGPIAQAFEGQKTQIDLAILGRLKLRDGEDLAAGLYNRDAIQDLISGGVSDIILPCGTWAIQNGLVVDGKQIRIGAYPGFGGSRQRRPRLQQLAGSTEHLIHMSGAADSYCIIGRLDLMGPEPEDYLTASGINTSAFVADACETDTRASVQFYDCIARGFLGSGAIIGGHRNSWVSSNASFLQCAEYGLQSIGCEDIYIQPGSQFGETGKTALWLDGQSSHLCNNMRLVNVDIYRGGMKFDGSPAKIKDASNVYVGPWIGSIKWAEGECFVSWGHGIYFDAGGATTGYSDHSISGVRFTANSRQASGIYSDVYTKMSGGHITLAAPIFSRFEVTPPSLPKYLVEIDPSSACRVTVLGPGFKAPSTGYAGSYVTARTNDNTKVQWFDQNFLLLARESYLRKAGVVSGDPLIDITGAATQVFGVTNAGAFSWGGGTSAPDIQMRRGAADVLELSAGDSFRALGGFGCTPLTAAPPAGGRYVSLKVMADQVTWDPLSRGSGGAYWVWWSGSAWRGMHEDASGNNLA